MSAPTRSLALLRIRRLVQKELRQLFRDPKTKRVIFAAPIIQLILFGYAVNTDVRDVATALVDHDHTAESRALVESLTAFPRSSGIILCRNKFTVNYCFYWMKTIGISDTWRITEAPRSKS